MSWGKDMADSLMNFWACLTPPDGRDSWFDIRTCACGDKRCRGELSCFRRNSLADAVSRAVSA